MPAKLNTEILAAAIAGFEEQTKRLNAQIAELRQMLNPRRHLQTSCLAGRSRLAEETGGEAYMLGFGAPVSFAPYLEEICGHFAHQYRVTLLIKPENKAGFRDVRFASEVPNAEVVAATRVYVPAAWEEPNR